MLPGNLERATGIEPENLTGALHVSSHPDRCFVDPDAHRTGFGYLDQGARQPAAG